MPISVDGPLIKICGIQTYNEAKAALDCGANALGFLVGLTHRAKDQIGVDDAKAIIDRLPAKTNTVLVTHLLDVERIAELAGFLGVSAIQVHGSVPTADLVLLWSLAADRTVLKAVPVAGEEAFEVARSYRLAADGLLLDSRTRDRLSGTGQTHDWSISRRIVEEMHPLPVYLAGGLTPDNVAEAIRTVRPAGVDVNSGVEDPQGGKSREPMARFVAEARKAFVI